MTLSSIYEESNRKEATSIVRVNGQAIPVYALSISQQFGVANSARFDIPNPVPVTFAAETPVEIYLGYDGLYQLAFTGAIVTPSPRAELVTMECAGEGRRLTRVYQRTIQTITTDDINDVIEGWLVAAGVTNYVVDLPARTVGAVVPYIAEFTTYGDAINQLAMIDGDPWYETPTGQIRVELKDPWPAPSPRRRYFSGDLVNLTANQRAQAIAGTLPAVDLQPAVLQGVVSADAQPRIRFGIGQTTLLQNVKNRVYVEGAMLDVPDGNGGTTSQRIEATAQAASPFITTPPTFKDITLDFPAIDTQAWANEIAFRYVLKVNRLEQQVALQVDGDAEVQLGMTVQVEDPQYTRITGNWFVYGLTHQMGASDFQTTYDLRGGVLGGTTPLLNPVADFIFANEFLQAAKINQVIPVTGAASIVTYDARSSFDPDGTIVSYAWSDDQGNTGSGSVITFSYPEAVDVVVMTLTVTDNDGLTDAISKTVDLRLQTDCGSSDTNATQIFAAIKTHATASTDGGQTWTDKTKVELGVTGDITTVSAFQHRYFLSGGGTRRAVICFYGTTAGELIMTNDALDSFTMYNIIGGAPIVAIDTQDVYDMATGEHYEMCWLITADGRGIYFIYRQNGGDYGVAQGYSDGFTATGKVRAIQRALNTQTGEAIFSDFGPSMIIGGNTSNPASLLRPFNAQASGTSVGGTFTFSAGNSGNSVPPFSQAMLDAIAAAGAGSKIIDATGVLVYSAQTGSRSYLTVVFDTGVSPRVWSYDPFTAAWSPATGLTGGVDGLSVAPGFDVGERVVVLNQLKTFAAVDQVTFVEGTTGAPSQIKQIVWETGLKSIYIAAAASGLVKSLDSGDNWGYIRPHAGVGTTWPGGAEGMAVDVVLSSDLPQGCANIYSLARKISGIALLRLTNNTWAEV